MPPPRPARRKGRWPAVVPSPRRAPGWCSRRRGSCTSARRTRSGDSAPLPPTSAAGAAARAGRSRSALGRRRRRRVARAAAAAAAAAAAGRRAGALDGAAELAASERVHVVFSTDCSPYQDYQAEVVFHSAALVGQRSPITRIASGRDDARAALRAARQSRALRRALPPGFQRYARTGKYHFYNKPRGLLHWLEHGAPAGEGGDVGDAGATDRRRAARRGDRPRLHLPAAADGRARQPLERRGRERVARGRTPRCRGGVPAGQLYGLQTKWTTFRRAYICGAGSPCATVSARDAAKYYPVGPPYILHRDDWLRLAPSWVEFVPKVYEEYPSLLAEMYAYCLAAAHLGLPHVKLDSFMVSNVDAYGEGWAFVDALDRPMAACAPPPRGARRRTRRGLSRTRPSSSTTAELPARRVALRSGAVPRGLLEDCASRTSRSRRPTCTTRPRDAAAHAPVQVPRRPQGRAPRASATRSRCASGRVINSARARAPRDVRRARQQHGGARLSTPRWRRSTTIVAKRVRFGMGGRGPSIPAKTAEHSRRRRSRGSSAGDSTARSGGGRPRRPCGR